MTALTSEDSAQAAEVYDKSLSPGVFIWGGSAGVVTLLPNGNALKSAHAYTERTRAKVSRNILVESKVYKRLPTQDRLLRFISFSPERGLELEYAPGGTLQTYLEQHAEIKVPQRLLWARDTAEGLSWLHRHGVVHCDLKPENLLLDKHLRIKLIDFEGSSIDGDYHAALESTRFCRPRGWDEQSTVSTDLFALGSTIYAILTGHHPYEDISDAEVEMLFKDLKFPSVEALPCADVMLECWTGVMTSADTAFLKIEAEMGSTQGSTSD